MRMSTSAIVARNVVWEGTSTTEPYEGGWAREAIAFVRALKEPVGNPGRAYVEVSPDGLNWVREGTSFALPANADEVTFARINHFGTWLRIVGEQPAGSSIVVLVTLHLKS
ncbi:hypothetical protein [Pelagibacterium lentulum]|uniref:Uncharacterized protein n=1 Tax=Pelagibacterium lentulum TaxID=2029865 RepID=A0A916RMG2_9HYPH|nr:hypothetical protein [Pelagibacterium lentulum]GGA61777.1 hypothetical protein GCM10011499_35110 [Pelagibacterium lentulum]